MVPTKRFPFPSIVVVVTGPTLGADICEYKELAVVFYDARIPGSALGLATHTRKFLNIGSRVLVTRHELQNAGLSLPPSRVGTVESRIENAKISDGQFCVRGIREFRSDTFGYPFS